MTEFTTVRIQNTNSFLNQESLLLLIKKFMKKQPLFTSTINIWEWKLIINYFEPFLKALKPLAQKNSW